MNKLDHDSFSNMLIELLDVMRTSTRTKQEVLNMSEFRVLMAVFILLEEKKPCKRKDIQRKTSLSQGVVGVSVKSLIGKKLLASKKGHNYQDGQQIILLDRGKFVFEFIQISALLRSGLYSQDEESDNKKFEKLFQIWTLESFLFWKNLEKPLVFLDVVILLYLQREEMSVSDLCNHVEYKEGAIKAAIKKMEGLDALEKFEFSGTVRGKRVNFYCLSPKGVNLLKRAAEYHCEKTGLIY